MGDRNAFYRTAGYKAPRDVNVTLEKLGFKNIFMYVDSPIKIISLLVILFRLIRFGLCLRKDDVVIMQYPSYPLLFMAIPFFLHCNKRIVLIHDFHSLRLNGRISVLEKLNLRLFNRIIVHTENMKDYLSKIYPDKQYYVLGCFGYILDQSHLSDERRIISDEICFAGNLDKSLFIGKLIEENGIGCKYHLYGNFARANIVVGSDVRYEGVFHPDEVGSLKGSWGLVWDGEDLSSCTGFLGEYLKINAPHKFSLYIAAGLPVIVWSKSAMAKLVKDKNIGIVINSLYDLKSKIDAISLAEYREIQKKVSDIGIQIRGNSMFKSVITSL